MTTTNDEIKWFGYPIRFYIDKIELPWFVFSLGLFLIYIWSLAAPLSYLGFLSLISLVGKVAILLVGVYFFVDKQSPNLPATLVYGGILGFFIGFTSALLAFLRFWYLWLFFNIVVESIITTVFGLVTALTIYYLRRLPWWPQKIIN